MVLNGKFSFKLEELFWRLKNGLEAYRTKGHIKKSFMVSNHTGANHLSTILCCQNYPKIGTAVFALNDVFK